MVTTAHTIVCSTIALTQALSFDPSALSPSDSFYFPHHQTPPTSLASLQLCFYFFSKKVYQSSGGEMVAHMNFKMGLVIGLILYPFNDFQGIGGSELQQLSCLLLKSLGNNLCPSRHRFCLCCTDSTRNFPHQGTCWATAEQAKPRDGPRGLLEGQMRHPRERRCWQLLITPPQAPPSPLHPMTRQTSARELTGLLQDLSPNTKTFWLELELSEPFYHTVIKRTSYLRHSELLSTKSTKSGFYHLAHKLSSHCSRHCAAGRLTPTACSPTGWMCESDFY